MNKDELKKVLKPLIKECIKEVLFEEKGPLSHIISEVANGLSSTPSRTVVTEQEQLTRNNTKIRQSIHSGAHKSPNKSLKEHKKKLLDAIGADAYGGVNIFEGTTPAPSQSSSYGSLKDQDPSDPGVDISSIFGNKSSIIFDKMMRKK